jgi:pimeloyl-ACP methyl ester carboxylesterase
MGYPIRDHAGVPVKHGKTTVGDVRLHYVTAGSGEPVVLLHGIPKTLYYWRLLIPLLSERYTVIAIDMRGFGHSSRPLDGFDMQSVAGDVAALMTELGHERFRVVGEDWGAAAAYQLAACYPKRVRQMVFQEMLLPGFGLEEWSFLTPANVKAHNWLWHVNFYAVPDYPEALLTGREEMYFNMVRAEAYDPGAYTADALEEYLRCYTVPGSLRCMFAVYRATLTDGEQNRESARQRLQMPVLAIGGRHYIGEEVHRQMEQVADDVRGVLLDWGHDLAHECPDELAAVLHEFFAESEGSHSDGA